MHNTIEENQSKDINNKEIIFPAIIGNKGEWSEIYLFLKLITESELFIDEPKSANISFQKQLSIPEKQNLKVHGVIRTEGGLEKLYRIIEKNDTKYVVMQINDQMRFQVKQPLSTLIKAKEKMKEVLKKSKNFNELNANLTFLYPILHSLKIYKLKSESTNKQDIKLILNDTITKQQITYSFSIKSEIGAAATLLNSSSLTNFYYELVPNSNKTNFTPEELQQINEGFNGAGKYQKKIKLIENLGFDLNFSQAKTQDESEIFFANLQNLNMAMPKILADGLLFSFKTGKRRLPYIIQHLMKNNFVQAVNHLETEFYQYNIKDFLLNSAMGMMPSEHFTGKQDASGGFLVLKNLDSIVGYFNNGDVGRDNLQNYLVEHTKIETPSSRCSDDFGKIIYDKESNKYYFALNLQIRFLKKRFEQLAAFLEHFDDDLVDDIIQGMIEKEEKNKKKKLKTKI